LQRHIRKETYKAHKGTDLRVYVSISFCVFGLCAVLAHTYVYTSWSLSFARKNSVLQCFAVCCSVLQCFAGCCSVLRVHVLVSVFCSQKHSRRDTHTAFRDTVKERHTHSFQRHTEGETHTQLSETQTYTYRCWSVCFAHKDTDLLYAYTCASFCGM